MSFRTNLRGLSVGVRRNLLRAISIAYKISPSRLRTTQPRLHRNDKLRLSSGLSVSRTFGLSFAFLLFALSFSSCSFNPNLQGKGELYIQGQWQQDSSALQQKLVTFSRYSIRFDCDSFFVKINDYSKVNYGGDTCMSKGHWAEYIRGAYRQRNDTLFLKGQFCNADFTLKTSMDCFRTGPYEEYFKVIKKTDSLVQLSGTSNIIPINLQLIKKTTCVLKPL
ncbi:MAG: fumarate hydratase [Bacteroidota bacterium]